MKLALHVHAYYNNYLPIIQNIHTETIFFRSDKQMIHLCYCADSSLSVLRYAEQCQFAC